MKLSVLIFSLFLFSGQPIYSQKVNPPHFMNVQEAQKRWGNAKFNAAQFRVSTTAQRAAMAADLLRQQALVGKERQDVRKILGDPDGYFFSDMILAYQIEKYSDDHKEAWQIVFVPDEKNPMKVGSVKIHQKCCRQ